MVLHAFTGKSDGAYPAAPLIADSQGNLYGTTLYGGQKTCILTHINFNFGHPQTHGCGVVFRLTPTGKDTVLYTFQDGKDGGGPLGGLIMDANGDLYGTTAGGGSDRACTRGCGTIFRLAGNGKETSLYAFKSGSDGASPDGSLTGDIAHGFYGITAVGGSPDNCDGHEYASCGTLFRLNRNGTEQLLLTFDGQGGGGYPAGALASDNSGNLYGTTIVGGSTNNCGLPFKDDGCGIVFRFAPDGTETVLYVFAGGKDGAYPMGGVVADSSGNMYGTTVEGGSTDNCGLGSKGCGIVFKLAPDGSKTVLHKFAGGNDGAYPVAGLIADSSGNLYGTTATGGGNHQCALDSLKLSGCGTVFKLAPNGTETILHAFAGGKKDGGLPGANLMMDSTGNLYGTTFEGGSAGCGGIGCGVVFKVTP
jgi:uncharacterized repeat protein (TIGR03803 family)